VDSQALVTALFGVATGAIGSYLLLVKRDRWRATAALALLAAALLNLITEGPHSPGEDLAKFTATAILMAIFVVATVVPQRRTRSTRTSQAPTPGLRP
jgi:drug/metabolite transporter (DMT)-like permease